MNSTRTTNLLLSVILFISIGNYLKTDSLGMDLAVQLEQAKIQHDLARSEIIDELRDIDWRLIEIESFKSDLRNINLGLLDTQQVCMQ